MLKLSRSIYQFFFGLSLISACDLEAQWSFVNNLSTDNTDVSNSMNTSGNATAVWSERNNSENRIFSINLEKIEDKTTYWSGSETICSAKHSVFNNLKIAVDSSWNSIAVWEEFDGTGYKIGTSTRPFKGDWSAPVYLSATTKEQSFPQVVTSPSGYSVVVWCFEGTIKAATYQSNGVWSNSVDVSIAEGSSDVKIGMDDTGNALAVWSKNGKIKFSRLSPGGDWTKPATIAKANSGPQLSVNDSGFAVVAWKDGSSIKASTSQPGQGWSSPASIEDYPYINDFIVAADGQGNALILWQQQNYQDGTFPTYTPNYLMASKLASGNWSKGIEIARDDTGIYNADVAFDGKGNALVVCNSYSAVYAVSLPYQKEWSSLDIIHEGLYGLNTRPKVSVDSTGYALVTWSDEYGAIKGIRWISDPKM